MREQIASLLSQFERDGPNRMRESDLLRLLLHFAGLKECDVTARILLERYGSIAQILKTDPGYLAADCPPCAEPGEPAVFLHLFKRLMEYYAAHEADPQTNFRIPEEAMRYACNLLRFADVETFVVFLLNSRDRLLLNRVHSRGTVNQTSVNRREIGALALKYNAHAIVVAHNHPTGFAFPTSEDDRLTEELYTAMRYLSVELVDHLVVGAHDACYSYRMDGKIEQYEANFRKQQFPNSSSLERIRF